MLTRIEIDGFKSFENFAIDLSPFTVVMGSNASGKSNLFDAIQLLSSLASADLRSALKTQRGDPDHLFRETVRGRPVSRMQFAVELLLEPAIRDPWGQEVQLTHTRVRYEVAVDRVVVEDGIPRFIVTHEQAVPIFAKDDRWRPFGARPSRRFRDCFLKYSRRAGFLETIEEGDKRTFKIHQDGKAGRTRPGQAAEATVLSSITTAEFPHLYSLREELRSWRLLQLDPIGLRRPSPLVAEDILLADGSNLAAVLYRIKAETANEKSPQGSLAEISAALADIVPGVLDVYVTRDDGAREYRATVALRDGVAFPTSVISDGTLRVLALLTLLDDPKQRGLVCFEEPENGIHPARLRALLQHLRDRVTDPSENEGEEAAPFSQLLLNSHSPVVLAAVREGEFSAQVFFADVVSVTDPKTRSTSHKTRIRPVLPNDQGDLAPEEEAARWSVSRFEVQRILGTVLGGA